MRLTRRGWVVLGVALVGTAMAARFGARSLNAVVLPALVALAAAVVQARLISPPTVRRTPPTDGFPDGTRTVELRFETDRPFTGVVSDDLPDGIDGESSIETTVGAEPVRYEVTYADRGEHTIGPARFVARDVLGLAETEFSVGATDRVIVYPRVRDVGSTAVEEVLAVRDAAADEQRHEFDRLREYERGDALRDVHWKSSAKRDDLIVKEFSAPSGAAEVSIAAGAEAGEADAMAEAAASLGVALLDRGVPVRLSTPGGSVEADPGGRRALLEHLARAGPGPVRDDAADVIVRAGAETRVDVGDRRTTFDRLVRGSARPTAGDAPSADGAGGTNAERASAGEASQRGAGTTVPAGSDS